MHVVACFLLFNGHSSSSLASLFPSLVSLFSSLGSLFSHPLGTWILRTCETYFVPPHHARSLILSGNTPTYASIPAASVRKAIQDCPQNVGMLSRMAVGKLAKAAESKGTLSQVNLCRIFDIMILQGSCTIMVKRVIIVATLKCILCTRLQTTIDP